MNSLVPGFVALALYGGVWLVSRRVQSVKERHVDRLTVLEDFEREISLRK